MYIQQQGTPTTLRTYAEVLSVIEIMEILYIRRGPQGHGMGGGISPHFQSVHRKFPINNCLVFPPLNLFSNKPKPLEKVLRLDSVNIQKIVIERSPHHCFSVECLEATS